MRDFKGMKRQRSRNRGGGGSGGGGGGKPQHNANRAFESNGPDGVKIRGAAQHVFEKYQQLARDALTAGDRVLGESYQQHAEHYFRVLRAVQPQRPPSDIIGRDAFTSGVDIDFEDEGGDNDGGQDGSDGDGDRGEPRNEWRQDNNRQDNGRQDGARQDGARQDNNRQDVRQDNRQEPRYEGRRDDRQQQQRDRPYNRDDRPRDERPRDDRPRDDRPRDERPREEKVREDRPRDERPREDRPRRFERPARNADPLAVVEPTAAPLIAPVEQSSSPILRSQDGTTSQAPAFLQARVEPKADKPEKAEKPAKAEKAAKPVEASEDGEARPRVRRRRAPRTFDGAADGAPAAADVAEDA